VQCVDLTVGQQGLGIVGHQVAGHQQPDHAGEGRPDEPDQAFLVIGVFDRLLQLGHGGRAGVGCRVGIGRLQHRAAETAAEGNLLRIAPRMPDRREQPLPGAHRWSDVVVGDVGIGSGHDQG
jgi:hypothetical protein